MTKKKQGKNEVIGKVNEGDVTDNKDINSQEHGTIKDNKGTEEPKTDSEELIEVAQVTEEDSGETPDKDASMENDIELKLAEMQDKYLRLSAEFDNYRKRTLREKIELTKHAGEKILVSLVPVMDDFERALKSIDPSGDCVSVKNGIDLIYNKFRDFLKQNGLREIESLNNDFNVDLHEAVNKIPVDNESMKGKVVEVVEKGYYLHDKVLRFSKVVVGE
jgi:molecular chaperone GrpE